MPSTDPPPASSGLPISPGPRHGRRIPGSRVLLIGAFLVVAVTAFVVVRIVQTSGPGPDPNTIPKRPDREVAGSLSDYEKEGPAAGADSNWVVPTRLAPILADSTLRGVVLNGERVMFEPGLVAWRVADEPESWLVEHTWFYIPTIPVRLHTYAEMKALDERGEIDDQTTVSMASYRWKLRAASMEEARREALRQIPTTPPAVVAEAVTPRPRGY